MSIKVMNFTFTPDSLKKIEAERKKYPNAESAVMSVLWIAQEQNQNWLSESAIQAVAEILGLSPAHVYGVATFYTMYNKQPIGKYHLQFCHNISCHLLGSKKLIEHSCTKLGIKKGETTSDGQFTISGAECLGSCGTAPAMMINDDYHENLTTESIDLLLSQLGAKS